MSSTARPVVGILVDGVTGFGRAVMRGVMRYANLQRRWIIHEETRHIQGLPLPDWPDCDGVITAGVGNADLLAYVRNHARHFIRCSGSADPTEAPVVCLDDEAVGRIAAQHLLDCQFRNFAFFGLDRTTRLSLNRFNGFRTTLQASGFDCLDSGLGWVTSVDFKGGRQTEKVREWLRSLPTPIGIMAVDDSAAHDLAALCLREGIAVPERIAIIGVNNDDLLCESAWPPLSSVDCDYSRVGYLAASMLDALLSGKRLKKSDRLHQLAPLGVVRRQSTDISAVENRDLADALRFIREHACDPCTVGDILRHVPVGRRWLERQFTRRIGRNPHDEIMRVRIETAKRLLLHPGLTLGEVASRCGFAVQQNLGRAFLNFTGMTPGAYRRESRRGSSGDPTA